MPLGNRIFDTRNFLSDRRAGRLIVYVPVIHESVFTSHNDSLISYEGYQKNKYTMKAVFLNIHWQPCYTCNMCLKLPSQFPVP